MAKKIMKQNGVYKVKGKHINNLEDQERRFPWKRV